MPKTTIELAQAFYAQFNAGDVPGVLDSLADDAVSVCPGSRRHIPWAGTWKGKEGFGELLTVLDEAVEVELYEPQRYVADGDERVIVFGIDRVRTRKSARVVEGSWVHELTFRDGKLCRFTEQYDTDTLAVALAG